MVILAAALVVTTSISGTGNDAAAAPSAGDWQRLRQCESGDSYTINTGNGYYGAYQFDLSTWQSVGGTGYPHQASPATQDALALKLWELRGWSVWTCAGILRLGAPTPTPPVGYVDSVQVDGFSARVSGWAADLNSPSGVSNTVHIYVGSAGYAFTANRPRPDVDAAYGISGLHGFSETVPLTTGANTICVYSIGLDTSNHTLLFCEVVQGPAPTVGVVDSMTLSGRKLTVNGWAYDPNSAGTSIAVHVYVERVVTGTPANLPRPDVNAAMGIPGQHGYSLTLDLKPGPNAICVYGIGTTPNNNNTLLQCRVVQVPYPPFGYVDSMVVSGSSVVVSGWAVDPNVSSTSIAVHLYVNGVGFAVAADRSRPDVNAGYGITGQHGFWASVPLRSGSNSVCVFSIGVADSNNTLLLCRDLQFNSPARQRLAAPSTATPGVIAGPAPANSLPAPTTAVPTTPTVQTTTTPATSPAASALPLLSSLSLSSPSSAPSSTAARSAPPSTVLTTPTTPPASKGALESLVMSGRSGVLTGWIADRSVGAAGSWVRITVNGITHDVLATGVRTDVAPPDGASVLRGFTDPVTLVAGSNEVCLYEIDPAGGISSAPVTCRTEIVQ